MYGGLKVEVRHFPDFGQPGCAVALDAETKLVLLLEGNEGRRHEMFIDLPGGWISASTTRLSLIGTICMTVSSPVLTPPRERNAEAAFDCVVSKRCPKKHQILMEQERRASSAGPVEPSTQKTGQRWRQHVSGLSPAHDVAEMQDR